MKKRKQRIQKLTVRYGSHHTGKFFTLVILTCWILAIAFLVFTIGPLTVPDFWQPVQVVDHIAELMVLSAISYVFIAQVGYSWHLFLASVDAAVHLMMEQANQSLNAWLTSDFIVVSITIDRYLPTIPAVALKSQIRAFLAILCQQLTSQRPKSKAPILLFQQAPLLVAP